MDDFNLMQKIFHFELMNKKFYVWYQQHYQKSRYYMILIFHTFKEYIKRKLEKKVIFLIKEEMKN